MRSEPERPVAAGAGGNSRGKGGAHRRPITGDDGEGLADAWECARLVPGLTSSVCGPVPGAYTRPARPCSG
jgi:hypothetical protein